jgi:hypothetical protein
METADPTDRALTLIHEGLHGITISVAPPVAPGPAPAPQSATDISYAWQRVIRFIGTPDALRNNDSYILFVRGANGMPTPSGADIMDDPDVGEQGSRAVAFLQGWLIWADQEIASLYKHMNAARNAGHWLAPYYMETMRRIAPLFDMTRPPAVPNESDQVKVAAIHDRLTRLMRLPSNSLTMNRSQGGSTHWEDGPSGPLTFGPDFYSIPAGSWRARLQTDLVLRKLLSATPDISGGFESKYALMIELIRDHHGALAP